MTPKAVSLVFLVPLAVASAVPVIAQPAGLFVTADRCIACHNDLVTPAGEDVSIGSDWRSSMMANAARDPYWHAAVRREIQVRPSASEAIQNECSACHMPMMRYIAKTEGEVGEVFAHLPIARADTEDDHLAADGVSCAVCHQIRDDGLGEKSSFSAGFVVATDAPAGRRLAYGPYFVDAGRQSLMRSSAGYLPVQAAHVQSSEMCATCHTLFTHSLDDDGNVIGEFPEQVPYLEWKHSAYRDRESCQSCHMPVVEGTTAISGVLGVPRENVSRHVFRGGNFFMPLILNRHRGELGVQALPSELATMSQRTRTHLGRSAARIRLEDVEIARDELSADVVIENLAGHKLPSAYPSRRVWIHFTVRDANDNVVFESGRLNRDGSIEGNDNDDDRTRFEPHYVGIRSPYQVQVYEAVMADPNDRLTTVLLSAVRYVKDNRILPDGFDKSTAPHDVAVQGTALQDTDFVDGTDRVRFGVDLPAEAEGPFTVEAELLYQPIGYRWAHNLELNDAPEIDFFVDSYDAMGPQSATTLARDVLIVD